MCGRFTLRTKLNLLLQQFSVETTELDDWPARYNIAPTHDVLAIRLTDDGKRELAPLRWGLIPSWSKDEKIGYRMINARSETVQEKPSFRAAFKRRRCLIPADGYFEWTGPKGKKQPYYIHLSDEEPLLFYGLWESWQGPKDSPLDEPLETCTIITTEAADDLAHLHDRMPCISSEEDFDVWLDPEFEDYDHLKSLLQPLPELVATPVSTYVNKVGNEGPECISEIS